MNEEFDNIQDVEQLEDARAAAEAAAKRKLAQTEADYVWLMSYATGRRIVWDLLDFAGLWRSSYLSGDREDTFFREGSRNVALRVWANLHQFCPELAHKMLEENKS